MKRIIEWILAAIGALICVIGAVLVWQSQPATPFGPMPILALMQMAIFGFVGLVGVSLDDGNRSQNWGYITWVICGSLLALAILGVWTIAPIVLSAVFAFVIAAILADSRRKRKILPDLGIFTISTVGNFVFLFLLIVIGSPR